MGINIPNKPNTKSYHSLGNTLRTPCGSGLWLHSNANARTRATSKRGTRIISTSRNLNGWLSVGFPLASRPVPHESEGDRYAQPNSTNIQSEAHTTHQKITNEDANTHVHTMRAIAKHTQRTRKLRTKMQTRTCTQRAQ